jgi:hypothetical protein
MKTSNTILASVALIFGLGAAEAAAQGLELIAGPMPAENFFDTLVCSAKNVDFAGPHQITLTLTDANDADQSFMCGSVSPLHSCSFAADAHQIGTGVSPFNCHITSNALPPIGPGLFIPSIQATLCLERLNTSGEETTCLQALPRPATAP